MASHALERERTVLVDAVRDAGRRALEISEKGPEVFTKPDHSPVTSGDLEVNRLLQAALTHAFPGDAWLSEENPDTPARLQAARVWIVDPIDGTKYFIDRVPQFAISVALVQEAQPVLAVVFNPATGELFEAVRGGGAMLNGAPIRVAAEPRSRFRLLGAPPAMRRDRLKPLEPLAEVTPMGSIAYTLALLAAGRADATVNLSRMNEWDVVAGVLLVREAGGVVFDSRGAAFRFNQPDTTVHGIIAGRPETTEQYAGWLAALGKT
jgi:myo-inositol-1(or 4)-monophosphatase